MKPPPPSTLHLQIRFVDESARLVWGRYGDGPASLTFLTLDGEPLQVATVNSAKAGLARDECLVKDWGENRGMLDFLLDAGLLERTGRSVPVGVGHRAEVCRWLVEIP
jgi:hypothetical protein